MKKCNSFDGNPKINLYEFLYLFQVRPRMQMLGYQFVPPPEAASAQLLPPLTPHQSLGQVAKPQHPRLPGYSGYDILDVQKVWGVDVWLLVPTFGGVTKEVAIYAEAASGEGTIW